MPAGRPPKPVELKRLQGTYRTDRDGHKTETPTELLIPVDAELPNPKGVTEKYVKEAYQQHAKTLIRLRVLSPIDIPELELMYITLQQLRKINAKIQRLDIIEELQIYARLINLQTKLSVRFSSLAGKYYISPTARIKLQTDALNLDNAKKKNETLTEKLLNRKKA